MKTTLYLLCGLLLVAPATAAAPGPARDEARARSLINALGCRGCHSFGGSGARLGPDLDRVGQTLSEAQILLKLSDPGATHPQSQMPAYGHLAQEDLVALAAFLAARP